MLLDQGAQSSFSGVQQFQPGVLAPQLLGFFLDLLGFALDLLRSLFDLLAVAPHAQDFALDQLHPLLGFALVLPRTLLDLLDLELDPAHGSPIESR